MLHRTGRRCYGEVERCLKRFHFRQYLSNEESQAFDYQALMTIVLGTNKIVFVGDHLYERERSILHQTCRSGLPMKGRTCMCYREG